MVGALPRYDLDVRTGNARNRNRMTSVHSVSAFGEAFGQVDKRDAIHANSVRDGGRITYVQQAPPL
jgi:hypothetical protein